MKEFQDILDLCRLNEMADRDPREELKAPIAWKRRQLVDKIAGRTQPASDETMERHRMYNTPMER